MKIKIPISTPFLDYEENESLMSAITRGEISGTHGSYLQQFERDFSSFSDCSYGVAVSSGTAALHLAVASLGIRDNEEVLVSSFTNMATFFAVLYERANPIPVDVEPDTWNIDPTLIEDMITEKTKAIIVVHVYGHPVNMDPIVKICKEKSLYLIEDCAEAHGALYKGKKVGSLGDVGCFSFYANKIITTGEGGMITTNDKEIADKAQSLKSLAFGKENKFMHTDIGFNYRMTNLQAAIGVAQLRKIDKIIEKKRMIARKYQENLVDVDSLQLPVEKPYARNVYWMYHVVCKEESGIERNKVMRKLKEYGIETRESFIPYNMQEKLSDKNHIDNLGRYHCPISNYLAKNGFYIPSSPLIKNEELDYVSNKMKMILMEK